MKFPYERIIQWASGPFAVFIGGLAAKWVSSSPVLGQVGLSKDGTAKAITAGTVFVVSTGATILLHQKWMTNLVHWWDVNTAPVVAAETAPVLQMRATSPQPMGSTLLEPAVPDNPDSVEWEQRRKDIADALPTPNPTK